mmetsp:Transcript_28437/g.64162  ORF Transcript_28437/g.64162 Transcript_28437/m.64162 type:complete len:254 (+) Transcript_28437:484-1245(+)
MDWRCPVALCFLGFFRFCMAESVKFMPAEAALRTRSWRSFSFFKSASRLLRALALKSGEENCSSPAGSNALRSLGFSTSSSRSSNSFRVRSVRAFFFALRVWRGDGSRPSSTIAFQYGVGDKTGAGGWSSPDSNLVGVDRCESSLRFCGTANGGRAGLRDLLLAAAGAGAGACDRGPPLARLELVGCANDPFLLGLGLFLLDPVEDPAEDLDESDPWLLQPPFDSITACACDCETATLKYRWQRETDKQRRCS